MGEYIGASIRFSGKLREQLVPDLIDLLNDKRLKAEWCDEPTRDNLGQMFADGEVNYGNLEELEMFGRQHGLSYEYWSDSGPEWDASTVRYFADTEETFETIGSNDTSLSINQIKKLGSWAALMNYIHRMEADLPPLEIVP